MMLLNEGNDVGAKDLAADLPIGRVIRNDKKIRHFVTWIALAVLLLALMFNYFVCFHLILKNHNSYKNYLKKSL